MSLSLDLPSSLPSGIYKIALDDLSSIKDEFQEHLSLSSILSIECVEIYSIARSLSKRVMSWIRPTDLNIFSSEDYHWKKNSEGLYLFVHGLQSHPHVWHDYIDQLKEKNPNVDIKAPYVTKRGNCSLEEATEPLKKMVLDYIEKHPGKPICFIGTSNGGRIIAFLSTFLRGYKTAIKVCSIAGVFLGTSVIKTIKKWGISRLLRLTNVILEELDEGTEHSEISYKDIMNIKYTNKLNIVDIMESGTKISSITLPLEIDGKLEYVLHIDNFKSIINSQVIENVNEYINNTIEMLKKKK